MFSRLNLISSQVLQILLLFLILKPTARSEVYEGFLPKNITGVSSFLEQYPNFDGRGIKIAVLDSGIDPGAPGLALTSNGLPKVIDVLDATGSGDVNTTHVARADSKSEVKGLSGRTLHLNPEWTAANPDLHLGVVSGFDIFPGNVISQYKKHAKIQMTETNKVYIKKTEQALETLEETAPEDAVKIQDLKDQLDLLSEMEGSFEAQSPVYDCAVFLLDGLWRAVIDTDEDGDLEDEVLLEDYSLHQKYTDFGDHTLVNFGVHIYDEGNLLSIVIPSSAHGTHVAGIIGAHFPDSPERSGIAPGVQLVSIKIGDTRLDGMETGIALQRALRMVKDLDCDMINMSYGEPTSTPNHGWFIDQVNELVREQNVVFVASAGNSGPALSTVGAPGGTSTSILAVGAYVHSTMMPLQYGMAHAPQDNLYTWSSRGPTTDGDIGVNFCAPGGAIAPVPTSSIVPAMQMNGTSMASPYACGSVALILSGLKIERIPYSYYDVRIAIEEGAKIQNHLDQFSQGYGLIQVGTSFDWFKSSSFVTPKIGFEIRNTSQENGRGILLREPSETKAQNSHSIRIEPVFPESVDTKTKASFEIWAQLSSDVSWIQYPDSVLIHQNGGKVNVIIDPSKLSEGAHFAVIKGKNQMDGQTLFKIPVTVIIGKKFSENKKSQWQERITLEPGGIQRVFLRPPSWAQWAEFTIDSTQAISTDRLALHTVQLLDDQRFNAVEWKRYISGESLTDYQSWIPVNGNPLMEWAFASYWSNRETLKLDVQITFKGVEGIQESYSLSAAKTPIRGNVQGIQDTIHLKPRGQLTHAEFSLHPKSASIQKSSDPRDILVDDRELHELNLIYEWNNTGFKSVRVSWNALSEVLYDSPYSSLLWKITNPNGKVIVYDDAWSEPVSLGDGLHQISLTVWHDDHSSLESLKKLPLNIQSPLSKPSPIWIGSNVQSAAFLKSSSLKFNTIHADENHSFLISSGSNPLPGDKTDKSNMTFTGTLQWTNDEFHHGAKLKSKVFLHPSRTTHQKNDLDKTPLGEDSNQGMEESWWNFRLNRLKALSKMEGKSEAFDVLYDQLIHEKPGSIEVQKALLERLDSDENRKQHLDSILPLLGQIIEQLPVQRIRDYFAVRHAPDSSDERKTDSEKKKQKALLLDLIYRKARALAYQETLKGEQTKAFEEALQELRSWVDTSQSPYHLLDVRELRRKKAFGSAIKLLNHSIEQEPDNLKLLNKRIKLFRSLSWPYWAHHEHVRNFHQLPKLVSSLDSKDN